MLTIHLWETRKYHCRYLIIKGPIWLVDCLVQSLPQGQESFLLRAAKLDKAAVLQKKTRQCPSGFAFNLVPSSLFGLLGQKRLPHCTLLCGTKSVCSVAALFHQKSRNGESSFNYKP